MLKASWPTGAATEGAVRRVVRNVGPEVEVEAASGRAIGNRLQKIPLAVFAGLGPAPAEMPLADTRRGVPLPAKQLGDRELLLRNERLRERANHVPLQPRPPSVPAREQCIASRRADRRRRVRVREPHPFPGQPINVRRGDLRCGVVTADISVSEIVRQDVNNIRFRRLGGSHRSHGRPDHRGHKSQQRCQCNGWATSHWIEVRECADIRSRDLRGRGCGSSGLLAGWKLQHDGP